MEPTLVEGERVLVNRLATYFGAPGIGDILVFHPPTGADRNQCGVRHSARQACPEPVPEESDTAFIKRVVAGPGDRLGIENGQPIVNGVKADEDFTPPCTVQERCDLPREITIPAEHYFMMGDNRVTSEDSRLWGPVPEDWIIGKVFLTYWPPDQMGSPD